MGFLAGKKLLITGVLSNRSIAYGIARACHEQGAELAFSYVGERFKERITEFAAEFGSKLIFDCDVGSDEQIDQMFKDLATHWPKFDGFVHSIGFAPREAIAGNFLDGLSRENFRISARRVYRVRRGQLGQMYRHGSLTANSRAFLQSIDGVGSDLRIFPILNCGKGQPGQTAMMCHGSSPARFRKVKIGMHG